MLIYVAHKYEGKEDIERAKKITHDLQLKDTENLYFCPLYYFSYLHENEISHDKIMELHYDAMNEADKIVVASDVIDDVYTEVYLAKRCNMEIEYLENA